MIPKHLNSDGLTRLLANRRQEDKYLDYFNDRMDFWYSVVMNETKPCRIEAAYQSFMLVAERVNRLYDLLS